MTATDPSVMTCSVTVNWHNQQNAILKTVKCKTALLELVRNEFRDLFMKVTGEKLKLKLQVSNLNIHKKFATEGKASLNFQENKTVVYLSNAPVSNLLSFLKILFVKMTSKKSSPKVALKERLFSNKPNSVTDISPVNLKDVTRVKDDLTAKGIDPRKRKLSIENSQEPVKKRCVSSLITKYTLTVEQKRVMDAVQKGCNIFFTGSAGTGKSYLLRHIVNSLPPDITVATASTGAAACLIGGITLHSFAGIGTGEGSLDRCLQLASRPTSASNWKRCKHLIIDEISMVNGKFFEKIEKVARVLKNSDKPFGGLQLILSGDFLQLPPVSSDATSRFCFQTEAWKSCRLTCFQLQQVHRQNDPEFIDMLNNIRIGRITQEIADKLTNTRNQSIGDDGIQATRLCCYTQEANLINKTNLENLKGEIKEFNAIDSDAGNGKLLDEHTPVEKNLVLKVGAQVMLVKNINVSKGLVNGARGVVIKFSSGLPVVKFLSIEHTVQQDKWVVRTSGGNLHTRRQLPLRLAWAFSIHKSQGLTLDCVEMNLSQVFEAGQAYVALSRSKSLKSLRVIDLDIKKVWANPDVLKFYRRLAEIEKRLAMVEEYIPLGRKK